MLVRNEPFNFHSFLSYLLGLALLELMSRIMLVLVKGNDLQQRGRVVQQGGMKTLMFLANNGTDKVMHGAL